MQLSQRGYKMIHPCDVNRHLNNTASFSEKKSFNDVEARTQSAGQRSIAPSCENPPKTSRVWKVLTDVFHWLLLKIVQIFFFLIGKNKGAAIDTPQPLESLNPYKPEDVFDGKVLRTLVGELQTKERELRNRVLKIDLATIVEFDELNDLYVDVSDVKDTLHNLLTVGELKFQKENKDQLKVLSDNIERSFEVLKDKVSKNQAHLSLLSHEGKSAQKYTKCLNTLFAQDKANEPNFIVNLYTWLFGSTKQVDKAVETVETETQQLLPIIKWSENSCYLDVVLWLIWANRKIFTEQIDQAIYRQEKESDEAYAARKEIVQVLQNFIIVAEKGQTSEIQSAREKVRKVFFKEGVGEGDFRQQGEIFKQQDSEACLRKVLDSLNHHVKTITIRQGRAFDSTQRTSISSEIYPILPLIIADFPDSLKEKGSIDFRRLIEFTFSAKQKDYTWIVPTFTEQFKLQLDGSPPPYLAFQIRRGTKDADNKTMVDKAPISMGPHHEHFHMALEFSEKDNPVCSNSLNYELVASINHTGNSVESGHYTIDIKKDDKTWVKADDMGPKISEYKNNTFEFNTKEAYILVYKYQGQLSCSDSDEDCRSDVSSNSSLGSVHETISSRSRTPSAPDLKPPSGGSSPRID